ncbi:MAG: ComF family protein [Candidatus Omnitrophota bacterium]
MNKVSALATSFINLIYPLHCASCGRRLASAERSDVCGTCRAGIKRNPAPYCRSCGRPASMAGTRCPECRATRVFYSFARSACMYEGVLKELIHKYKYNNRRGLSGVFAAIMLDFIGDNPDLTDSADIITFVPLHRKNALKRGFNQSELLASLIGKSLNIPVAGCLEKTRSTKNQNELSREERLVNLVDAFRIKADTGRNAVKGAGILVIDDVMTTGATLNEAARLFMGHGARSVRCLTLARGT